MNRRVPGIALPHPPASPEGEANGVASDRLRFETLLSQLSATFIHLPAHEVDSQVERGLQQIVEFLGIDRSSLAQFSRDGSELIVTHSWTAPGFPPFPRANLAVLLPWYTAQIRRGEVMRFTRLPDELPPEAVNEREYCRQSGFRTHVAVPFKVGESLLGGIGFGSFRREIDWPDALVRRLQLVGEVFANALARKRAEEEEARLREQLALVARIAMMGELAASIAHEVNQPLCAIVSNAQAIQRTVAAGGFELEELREALEDITLDGLRASSVIARIRGLLQKGPVERTPVDVNDLVREVCGLMRGDMARRGVAVKLDLAGKLSPVLGDRVQVQQVIVNLMTNGAEAMDGMPAAARELFIRSAADGAGAVALFVRDAGAGLEPRTAGRIFEPFFTTRPGGMGLGLAICKSIAEAHGGRVEAVPNAGAGTTFRVTLPAAPAESGNPKSETNPKLKIQMTQTGGVPCW